MKWWEREWENVRWKREVESKSTLSYYRMKQGIGGVQYDNSWGAMLMFRARANTLKLGWRERSVSYTHLTLPTILLV